MYRRPKFLELLIEIRQEMAREADYDVDLFAEMVRSGRHGKDVHSHSLNGTSPDEADQKFGKAARTGRTD